MSTPTSSTTPVHTPASTPQPPMGANKVRFTKEELKEALEPPLLKMYNCEPEAIPFRVPVDPKQLNIPDYFEIIKKPMDLGTIRERFDNNYYFSSDEAMADFNQVFENCYIYNNPDDDIADMCKDLEWFYHAKMAKLPEEEEVALHEDELLYAEESSEDGVSDDDLP